ncbi:MAG: hypothetical protein HY053_07135 [Proteobacteria bacterium]|nr:hypothetical protein [Pseudomonadota bacterium]
MRAGFMLAPLLYMLALAGIGAAVMFSGYSQILRSNAEMTAVNTARSQLQAAGQTLSASAVLDSATSTIVQPPAVYSMATVASGSDAARLPTSYGNAGDTGTPHDVGVIDVSTGVKQLDPWGKFYIYCRWENAVASPASPAITVISAGPDGTLNTKCGDTAAQGDDRIITSTVAETINRANVWQVSSSSQVKFGIDTNAVKVNQDGSMTAGSLTLTTPLALTSGGTGAATAGGARTNLGSTATGDALFTAATAAAARSTLGSTTVGDAVFTAATAGAARTTLGSTAVGDALFTAATAAAGRTTLGSTTVGDALFIAATAAAGRSTLGSTSVGDALFIAASAGAARATLGSTSVGDALFIAADAASGRSTLGLGTMATQNANAIAVTGGTMSGVAITGDITGNASGSAGSVAATGVTGCCVAITAGGTGAATAAGARSNLGTDNATNLTSGTLDWARLPDSGVTAGTYTWGTVTAKGIVTAANNVSTSQISQGDSGISVGDTGSNGTITFTNDGVVTVVIDPSGNMGIGTATPTQKLDVYGGNIAIRGAAGSNRSLIYTTAATNRWAAYTNSTAEGGSNVGSDYVITSYDDSGAALINVLTLTRSSGAATFAGSVTATGGLIGNLTGNVVGNVTGTLTGNVSLPDGVVTAPGLYFTNDTNTGLYRVGADVMGLAAGGTDVARFTGGTSNVNYLNISGAAASSHPSIAAAGTDTNISIILTPKGAGTVGIGTATPAASALVDIYSTTKGLLPPRVTTAQRDAISSPATGLTVYNTTTNKLNVYNGSAWVAAGANAAGSTGDVQFNNAGDLAADTGNFYWDSTNHRLGIATNTPAYPLDVNGAARAGTMIVAGQAGGAGTTGGVGSGVAGAVQISDGSGGLTSDGSYFFWDATNHRLGLGTTTPSSILGLGGAAARTIGMERGTASNTAGYALTLQSGGATSGATDKAGGDLVFSSGTSTGTGTSKITFKTFAAGSSGTTDNTAATAMTILGSGYVGIGSATPAVALDVVGAGAFTGTMTASLFSGSGASLTTLNASNLSSGTVGTARLGSG